MSKLEQREGETGVQFRSRVKRIDDASRKVANRVLSEVEFMLASSQDTKAYVDKMRGLVAEKHQAYWRGQSESLDGVRAVIQRAVRRVIVKDGWITPDMEDYGNKVQKSRIANKRTP